MHHHLLGDRPAQLADDALELLETNPPVHVLVGVRERPDDGDFLLKRHISKLNSPVDHTVQLLLLQVVAHHHLQHLRSQNRNHFIEEFAFRHREEFLPRYEAIAVNVIDLESEPEVSIALR